MRDLEVNFTNTHQTEKPLGFSEVDENTQLLIAVVSRWISYLNTFSIFQNVISGGPAKKLMDLAINSFMWSVSI
jgi:hypothetical protein